MNRILLGVPLAIVSAALLMGVHLNSGGRCGFKQACEIGDANVLSVQLVTDGTGNGEVILPTGSVATGEILDGTLLPADEALAGRASFVICGEATTINNNTVYYGPIDTIFGEGQNCDIDEAGNTTEATADAPVFTATAFNVLGMVCRNEADANAAISYTLRTAAGATSPSVTCSIADNARSCVADVQTTTAIASGATVAIAAASTSDVADANGFVCTVNVAF